jgi:hypothetical protein
MRSALEEIGRLNHLLNDPSSQLERQLHTFLPKYCSEDITTYLWAAFYRRTELAPLGEEAVWSKFSVGEKEFYVVNATTKRLEVVSELCPYVGKAGSEGILGSYLSHPVIWSSYREYFFSSAPKAYVEQNKCHWLSRQKWFALFPLSNEATNHEELFDQFYSLYKLPNESGAENSKAMALQFLGVLSVQKNPSILSLYQKSFEEELKEKLVGDVRRKLLTKLDHLTLPTEPNVVFEQRGPWEFHLHFSASPWERLWGDQGMITLKESFRWERAQFIQHLMKAERVPMEELLSKDSLMKWNKALLRLTPYKVLASELVKTREQLLKTLKNSPDPLVEFTLYYHLGSQTLINLGDIH